MANPNVLRLRTFKTFVLSINWVTTLAGQVPRFWGQYVDLSG
jgi:hypothetical protein